jgi:hypothetical protein
MLQLALHALPGIYSIHRISRWYYDNSLSVYSYRIEFESSIDLNFIVLYAVLVWVYYARLRHAPHLDHNVVDRCIVLMIA